MQPQQTIKCALNRSVHKDVTHLYRFLIKNLNTFGAEESKEMRNY